MRLKDLFEEWGLSKLKVKTPVLEMEWTPSDHDKNAAWDLYVELLTRVTTQRLDIQHGTEKAALESVYRLFELTRTILKAHGRKAENFAKIAIIVLNQVIRPFATKWHRLLEDGALENSETCMEFRADLESLQNDLRSFTKLLADLADVEDLTEMENSYGK